MIRVATTHEQRAMCVLTGLCGLRISEAMDCELSWLDLHEMTLRVRGKGDKTRYVPVSKIAWSILSGRHAEVLLSGGTRYITCEERNARDTITRLAKRASLSRRVASHDLRATFATAVYDRTKDPRVVQELLGHASLTTTQIYIGVTMKAMREAVEL